MRLSLFLLNEHDDDDDDDDETKLASWQFWFTL